MMKHQKGIALLLALLFMLILTLIASAYLLMTQTETKRSGLEENYVSALSIAEAGAERAIWELKQNMNWQPQCSEEDPIEVEGGSYWIELEQLMPPTPDPMGMRTRVRIISTGRGGEKGMLRVGSAMRRIEVVADITGGGGLSDVFDYIYFLNNWGWWYWGGGNNADGTPREWARGEMRTNGRFDFQPVGWADTSRPPQVDDDVYAHFAVDMHNYPLRGVAGSSTYQHPESSKSNMPNLQDPDFYRNLALRENGRIEGYDYEKGTVSVLIDEIYGDDEPHSNIILIGTSQNPLKLNGPVYVEGNVIIKGTVSGQGTIYSGRNIYIAGNITYKNPPVGTNGLTPTPFPQTTKPTLLPTDNEVVDWYNRNTNKDIIGLAAKEHIVLHDYTSRYWCADNYGLFTMGSEDVGRDGIPDTEDKYEGDDIWQKDTEDLDGDGQPDMDNYSWKDITTSGGNSKNTNPLNNFANRPPSMTHYSQVCDLTGINRLEGIYYTQHAMAGRLRNFPVFNGSLISKDEVMVYGGGFTLNYDFRYHSHYRRDPNWPINLNLPPAPGGSWVDVLSWKEVNF